MSKLHCRAEIDSMLEKAEYSTVLSSDRQEAIAHIEQDPPYDLVLSDLMAAGMHGIGPARANAPGTTRDPAGAGNSRPR